MALPRYRHEEPAPDLDQIEAWEYARWTRKARRLALVFGASVLLTLLGAWLALRA